MDGGPHSHECATAHGAECFCDCHGTRHGVVHVGHAGGTHGAGVVVTAVKGAGGKVSHYLVVKKGTGLAPGGGTPQERRTMHASKVQVRTSSRPATLSPPLTAKAHQVRESLPKTAEDWSATIPRHASDHDRAVEDVAKYEAEVKKWQDRRQSVIDSIRSHMIDVSGFTPKKADREIQKGVDKGIWVDIQRADQSIGYAQDSLDRSRERLAGADTERRLAYPQDAWRDMPPEELKKHLAAVLDVGREAMTEVKQHHDRDPEIQRLRQQMDARADFWRENSDIVTAHDDKLITDAVYEQRTAAMRAKFGPDVVDGHHAHDERAIRKRESEIVREVLAQHRPFGNVHHVARPLDQHEAAARDAEGFAGRADSAQRIHEAEGHFPDSWVRQSAGKPLNVMSSRRAYYSNAANTIALSTTDRDRAFYNGAFADETAEVTVHELGHRMEYTIPGLTHLEFAYVRQRSIGADGKLERPQKLSELTGYGGYDSHEVAYPDKWAMPYAGKTYEGRDGHPDGTAGNAWELFQVGLQDLYGRSGDHYDDTGDLQAFTIGTLLTLG